MKHTIAILLVGALFAACGGRGDDEEAAEVFFANLKDGDTVTSPVKVEMGVTGMKLEPAGPIVEGSGHHHILINKGPMPFGEIIPNDETHRHYGKAQTEAELELEPGEYQLTLQYANGIHASYGPDLAASINITVE